eukprot:365811-Chlamydomonas_euryale.AAC.26
MLSCMPTCTSEDDLRPSPQWQHTLARLTLAAIAGCIGIDVACTRQADMCTWQVGPQHAHT